MSVNKREKLKYPQFPIGDPHCHTLYSDGSTTLEHLVLKAKKVGFSFVMKADHNTTRGNQKLKRLCDQQEILFIPGIEISTRQGHLLGINVMEWERKSMDMVEAIDILHDINGIGVICHPWWRNSMREKCFEYKNADGFEGLNGASPFGNLVFMRDVYPKPKMKQKNLHALPAWAGSDSHSGVGYGAYYNIFQTTDISVDGILEAMRKGKFTAVGPFLPLSKFIADAVRNTAYQLKTLKKNDN